MLKAALIDMDGVLYDSMPLHCQAWEMALKEAGLEIPGEEIYLYEGMTGVETVQLLFGREKGIHVPEEEALKIYARKADIFNSLGNTSPMPGADRMLNALLDAGVTPVLVTGSSQSSLLSRLDEDYPGVFAPDMRVTAQDVKRGKPDPEPYLKGLELSGVRPEEAMVIENAPLGVRAGKGAGLFTLAVTTGPIDRSHFIREKADLILPSMPALADAMPDIIRNLSV